MRITGKLVRLAALVILASAVAGCMGGYMSVGVSTGYGYGYGYPYGGFGGVSIGMGGSIPMGYGW